MAKEKREYDTKYGKNAWRMEPGQDFEASERERRQLKKERAKRAKKAFNGEK